MAMTERLGSIVLAVLALAGSAAAQSPPGTLAETPPALLRSHLEQGRARDAATALTLGTASDLRRQAQAMAEFTVAVEGLVQGLYRHGLQSPRNAFMPVLRLPIPINTAPEPLDISKLRAIYQTFLDDLARARATLSAVRPHDGRITLDINAIQLTLAPGRRMSISAVAAALRNPMLRRQPGVETWETSFDYADALWLQGYTHLLASMFEFVMAHDWSETYASTAHLFFLGARRPAELTDADGGMVDQMLGSGSAGVADQVAFLHLMHWQAGDKARMSRVRQHMKSVTELSRATWKAVRAETDDDREWLPSPTQVSRAVPSMPVSEDQIAAWLQILDELDALLDGRKLIPHWRFTKGINLRKVFEDPKPFDLLLWATGHAATPFLEDGPTISRDDWFRLTQMFRGGFLGYAVFFN